MRKYNYTYNNQHVAAVSINTTWIILKLTRKKCLIIRIHNEIGDKLQLETYPLLGPLGAKMGQTMPTTPQRMVKTAIGRME